MLPGDPLVPAFSPFLNLQMLPFEAPVLFYIYIGLSDVASNKFLIDKGEREAIQNTAKPKTHVLSTFT